MTIPYYRVRMGGDKLHQVCVEDAFGGEGSIQGPKFKSEFIARTICDILNSLESKEKKCGDCDFFQVFKPPCEMSNWEGFRWCTRSESDAVFLVYTEDGKIKGTIRYPNKPKGIKEWHKYENKVFKQLEAWYRLDRV